MLNLNFDYTLAISVIDDSGEIHASLFLAYSHKDSVFAAFGHAVEGVQHYERDLRHDREAIRAAHAERERIQAQRAERNENLK